MRISDWSSDVCSSDLAIQQVGQGLHHSEIERLVPVAGRDPLQQASPLLAIVELLLLQVLRQEMLDVGAKSAREQEGDEQQDAGEQEHGLHRAAPGAADAAHVVGGRRHERQVEAGAEDYRRAEHQALRQAKSEVTRLARSEEPTSELQPQNRIAYAVFC